MAGFVFRNRSDAEAVLELLNTRGDVKPERYSPPGVMSATDGWIFKTPAGGIPARVGTTCGKADCAAYYIAPDGELTELLDADDNSYAVEVFHIFEGSDIAGGRYIQAKKVFGVLVADAEDCGA